MEKIDKALQQRVWERVKGEQSSEDAQLLDLIAQEWTDAATYLTLSRKVTGKASILLRRLYEEEQTHAACLKGIYTLVTGQKPSLPPPPQVSEPITATLRRCYGREMQCLARYESRSAHPEYGAVFSKLAQQEQVHCKTVLELIGMIGI